MGEWGDILGKKILGVSYPETHLTLKLDNGWVLEVRPETVASIDKDGRLIVRSYLSCEIRRRIEEAGGDG